MRFGSFARRYLAALLDSAVWVIGIFWFLAYFPQGFFEDNTLAAGIIVLVLFSAWFNYFAICEWRYGQTIGKNAFGLRVLPVDSGAELSYNDAAVRNLLRLVDFPLSLVGIDWIIVSRSPRKQRIGDMAAKTVVLREPEKTLSRPLQPAVARPTSGELFGDASEALGEGAKSGHPRAARMSGVPASSVPAAASEPSTRAAPAFPYSNWGPKVAIVGVIVAILGGVLFGIPAILIDNPPSSGDLSTAANVFVQFATVLGFFAVPVFVARRRSDSLGEALRRLGVRGFSPSAIKWMFAAAGTYLFLAALYSQLITQPKQEDIASSFGPVWIQVVLIVICAATSEELCFRGMLFGGIRERLPGLSAALASGVIFGALHALTGITAVPPLIVFGTVLALLYERTGSILPGVILHALNNSAALLGQ